MKLAVTILMECYFGSASLPEDNQLNKTAVVAFSIPEVGIKFKAPFDAVDTDHSDFASLLALLEFIDGNQKYFSNRSYRIVGHNLHVVKQVNQQEEFEERFQPLVEKALAYRSKYRFSLEWAPPSDKQTYDSLFD